MIRRDRHQTYLVGSPTSDGVRVRVRGSVLDVVNAIATANVRYNAILDFSPILLGFGGLRPPDFTVGALTVNPDRLYFP
jgi:hypothetical protein